MSEDDCLLCRAEQVTARLFEDEECWVADCMVCATPWVGGGVPGPPDRVVLARPLEHLARHAATRYGDEGYWVDGRMRRIPDHWHAHARPAGGFFDPASELFGKF